MCPRDIWRQTGEARLNGGADRVGPDTDRDETRAAGFDLHLGKPIDANELLRQVECLK